MKRAKTICCAILATLCSAEAEEVWAAGVSRESGWHDMNKVDDFIHKGIDDGMCWLASGSNTAAWWQENSSAVTFRPQGLQTAEDIWEMCKESFENEAGTTCYFWTWYFNGYGINARQLTELGKARGNYYDGIVNQDDYVADMRRAWNLDASLDIRKCLEDGCVLTLSIFSDQLSHVITLWGADFNDETGYMTKLYVTDSDDDGQGFGGGLFAVNCQAFTPEDEERVRYRIYTEGHQNAEGMEYYRLEDDIRISWYDVLKSSRIPEPASGVLALLALAALPSRRRR